MNAWMRDLQVILTSEALKQRLVFGNNDNINLSIEIEGMKYLSVLRDEFSIRISNLSYTELICLIKGQFYDVEIKAGYKSLGGAKTIFKGGVLYITNELGDKRTNTAIILCAPSLVAKYGQRRMNLTLNSGINMYAAMKFICRRAGISDANISEEFKRKFLVEGMTTNSTVASFFDTISSSNDFAVNSDESYSGVVTAWDPFTTNKRVIKLTKDNIIFTGGYPRLTSEGVRLTVLPTFNFVAGDTVIIDNSWLDISASSREEAFKNYAMYLDSDGQYMVFQIGYKLCNRSSQFQLELLCKSRALIKKTLGGASNV